MASINTSLSLLLLLFSNQAFASSATFVDLQFDLKLRHVPQECRSSSLANIVNGGLANLHNDNNNNHANCRLSYAISVLQSLGDFDLNAVMLQEGYANHVAGGRRHFREDTIVAVPASVRREEEWRVYIGIRIYGLPNHFQDYFIVDVTKLLRHSTATTSKSVSTVDNDDLSFAAIVKQGKTIRLRVEGDDDNNNACLCNSQTKSCRCCSNFDVPKINLVNRTGCVNFMLGGSEDRTLAINFYFNEQLVFNSSIPISSRHAQRLCFQTPWLKDYANLCLQMQNLVIDRTAAYFDGCVRLNSELYHMRLQEREMGCFHWTSRLNEVVVS